MLTEQAKWKWFGRIVWVAGICGGFTGMGTMQVCTMFIIATIMLSTSALLPSKAKHE